MDRCARILLPLLWLSLLLPAALQAEIKITEVDLSSYPSIEATVELPARGDEKPTFVVYEDYGSGQTAQNLKEIVPDRRNAQNWVVVIDATKSVPKKDFLRSRKAALNLVRNLPDSDRVAVYRINGKPIQIISMTALSSDRARVLDSIEGIERTGMKTRIYDALYVGLDHARKAKTFFEARGSVLILFTDGRDEGSYLSDEDAISIAGEAREARIPVYTILNGQARGEEHFQKIALKTGGEVFRGQFPEKKLQPSSDSVARYTIRYASSARVWEAYPGKEVNLRIEYLNEANRFAESAYEVPFRLFDGQHSALGWILLGLGLILLVAFFVLIWLALRRASIRRKLPPVSDEVMQGWEPDKPVRSLQPQPGGQVTDVTEALAKSQNPDAWARQSARDLEEISPHREDELSARNSEETEEADTQRDGVLTSVMSREEESRSFQTEMPYRSRRPETISLELKEKSYQVLQMALRDAPRYEFASLILVGGDPYRRRNEYDLFLDETYLGRSPSASLVVADKSVSMLHGKIRRIDQRFVLFDLVSDTGTYLNGKRVLRPRPLRNGDEIQIGHTVFEFRGKATA
ncbi:MAG: VWA domain-containing protein [Leptospiraceae bacterium]|nr:VWA domain-containing protein [Leptospiraceae bacterium]